jgi:acetyltransferase
MEGHTTGDSLDKIFNPVGMAVIGASSKPNKAGHQIVKLALEMGYNGNLYPINPSTETILGLKCYKKVSEVPGTVELVVIILPASACVEVAEDVVERNKTRGDVAGVVVISGGFKEIGSEGRKRENKLREILTSQGIRLIGPNCLGIMNTSSGVNTTFDIGAYPKGGLSIVGQSGAFSVSYLKWAHPLGLIGLNKYASIGNMADLNVAEIIKYLGTDDTTRVITLYLEGVANAKELIEAATEVTKRKPIVAIKVGKTPVGSEAAQTHTGSIAGSNEIYEGAFRQAGVIRAGSVVELYDTSRALSKMPLPQGNRIAVLTAVGGPGTICLDELSSSDRIQMAPLTEKTKQKLIDILPPAAAVDRPKGYIDMSGTVNEELQHEATKVLLGDRNVDGLIFLTTPPAFLDQRKLAQSLVSAYKSFPKEKRKTFLCVFGFGYSVPECRKIMEGNGLPTMEYADVASRVMINMVQYSQYQARVNGEKRQDLDDTKPSKRQGSSHVC